MSELKVLSNGQVVTLLDSDELGDPGDVMTRVGADGAAYLPPSGGGGAAWGDITGTLSAQTDLQSALDAKSPAFDQALNTDDTVVFASVELGALLIPASNDSIASTGSIRAGQGNISPFSIFGLTDVNDRRILFFDGDVALGNNDSGATLIQGFNRIELLSGATAYIGIDRLTGIDISNTDLPINLGPGSANLTINGTPGVTDAAIVVDGVTLSFTKGILTGVA